MEGTVTVESLEAVDTATLTDEDMLTFLSTAGLPVSNPPRLLVIDPNEPHRRLKTRTDEPALQAILDALPVHLLQGLPKEQRQTYVRALETADSFKQLIANIVSSQTDAYELKLNHLLAQLDIQRYHRRWICPKCSQRWGRHDPKTLKCPDMNPFTKGEIGG